jgi:hypothetical protein
MTVLTTMRDNWRAADSRAAGFRVELLRDWQAGRRALADSQPVDAVPASAMVRRLVRAFADAEASSR